MNANVAFLHYRTGALLAGNYDRGDGTVDEPGIVARHVHRADLHAVLARGLEARAPGAVRVGRRLVGVDQKGDRPIAHFQTGETASGDILIGADGVKSVVRAVLWGEEKPRFTGQVAWRRIVPAEAAKPFMSAGRAAVYMGPDRVVNRYTLRRGAILNIVAIARTADWQEEGWSSPGDLAQLAALFADWHPDIRGALSCFPSERPVRWGLLERDPLPQWSDGRMTLLGDAAHPMLPFLGLGAAMAIEDAAILGRALGEAKEWKDALATYERVRKPRTGEVYRQSQRQGELIQARDPDNFDAAAAPNANPRFFDYDPVTAPLV